MIPAMGVQFGVGVGAQMRGEQLRALLALWLFGGFVRAPNGIYAIVAETV